MPINYANKTFKEKLDNLFEISDVRAHKLLEMIQYGLIMMFLSFIIGTATDKFIGKFDKYKSIWRSILIISIQAIIIIVVYYYINKIVLLFPFVLRYSDSYVQDMQGETSTWGIILFGIFFMFSQKNFYKRADFIRSKLLGEI
jgi:hypothetical protein